MHTLQPKHTKLKKEEVERIVGRFNVSVGQLPKISKEDVCVPKDCVAGDIVRIERWVEDKVEEYFRVVS